MNRKYTYTTYFVRMLHAAAKLTSRKAAVVGMHFERWARKQTGFGTIGLVRHIRGDY